MAIDCAVPIYFEASWKGIAFHCDSSSDSFGRRGESYVYPLSETVAFKDLGRKARTFKVEGYLIGANQTELTVQLARAAESPEPGTLVHPMYGRQQVSCVLLTTKQEYLRDRRRTRLSFDFIEANFSAAPYAMGATVSLIFDAATEVLKAIQNATWDPVAANRLAAGLLSLELARQIEPAVDEESWDAIALLEAGQQAAIGAPPPIEGFGLARANSSSINMASATYMTFAEVIDPIANGTATIRQIHVDAQRRLRIFNSAVVDVAQEYPYNDSIQSMIIGARLALIRDYALAAMERPYKTIKEALDDLQFVMNVYDDEERAAADRGDDVLVLAIRKARATAAQGILSHNIRLPGLVESETDGLWPSLVVSHKLYADATRYEDVENYNQSMPPFWIGRTAVAPADTGGSPP